MSFYQNGILISGVNTLPELTRAQYEALPADKRPEYWVCLDEEYEPASSGHEIENSAGTKLTQRDVMQVLDGLEAVDDSTNQKTKIKMNLPIVSNADWNAMTEQEKTAYKASHYRFGVEVPDTEGVINAEYMKLLWENPNTTQAFPAQTITLNSADYDFLMFIYSPNVNTVRNVNSSIFSKGNGTRLGYATATGSGVRAFMRTIAYVSDTSLTVSNATYSTGTTADTTDNAQCIPIAIYGIKKNFQFKVNAIATDLSTRADHCFLSDNETSVEEALGEKLNKALTYLGELSVGTGSISYGNHKHLALRAVDLSSNYFSHEIDLDMFPTTAFYHQIGGNSKGDIIVQFVNSSGNNYLTFYRCTTGSTVGGTLQVYARD